MAVLEKESTKKPHTAMVLAAGLGTRLRPITDFLPKALIKVQEKTLLERILDRLEEGGIERIIVNSHYFTEQIEAFIASRNNIVPIFLSKEEILLETGGAIVKALPLLGEDPFYILAGDMLYEENSQENALALLASHWDDTKMDALLLLQEKEKVPNYKGQGDFNLCPEGTLSRPNGSRTHLFISLWMAHPRLYANPPPSPFSNSHLFFDRMTKDLTKKLHRIYGVTYLGKVFHISTPSDLAWAEKHYGC